MERARSYTDSVSMVDTPEITFTEIDDEEEEMIRKRTMPLYSCHRCDIYLYCCQKCCLIDNDDFKRDEDRDPKIDRIKEYQYPSSYSTYKSCCYRTVCGCVARVYQDEESCHVCFGFVTCFVFAPFFAGLLCSL